MVQPAAPGNVVGSVLSGKYRLTREIGRGGMGVVYAAEAVEPRSGGGRATVAIKVLHAHFVSNEQVMSRFMEESRTSTRLIHPNILRVHECLAAGDGSPYLVMDLLEGDPLAARTRDGRVALEDAVPIVQGILAGIEAAHANGVVHRDLKPGNVFLERTGDEVTVKLLDFGIAKVMDAAGGMGTKTQAGALLGTPAYMSPEQVKSAKDVDARSDLWSIGVMFYEMLAGRVAFAAPTEYARLAAVLSAQPTPIESIDLELAIVAPFLERALEKDRDKRFQTAREMSDALTAVAPVASARGESGVPTLDQTGNAPSGRAAAESVGPSARSAWSLVTDKTGPVNDATPVPATLAPHAAKGVLTAVVSAGHSSTLASPNRGPSVMPPAPLPVLVVADEELAARARERQTTIPPERPQEPEWAGVAPPIVAMLVTVALALGFSAGVLFDRFR